MPPKRSETDSPSSSGRENKRIRPRPPPQEAQTAAFPPPSVMATQVQNSLPSLSPPQQGVGRIILPLPFHPSTSVGAAGPTSLPLLSPHQAPSPLLQGQRTYTSSSSPYTPSNHRPQWGYFPPQDRSTEAPVAPFSPAASLNPSAGFPQQSNPRKRSYDEPQTGPPGLPPPLHLLTPSSLEQRDQVVRTILPPLSAHGSTSNVSTPTGTTTSFPPMGSSYSRQQSEASSSAMASRCSLHIRQQPRAARAGPDGKDRRNIDPPPVLQLMMTDFDHASKTDVDELRSNFYVVHCKLLSAQSPSKDVSTSTSVGEDGSKEINRLLLGTLVSSPFFCADDPDPLHTPGHPTSQISAPPSPSSRFFAASRRSPEPPAEPISDPSNPQRTTPPGSFFIFADLSVRRAGEYRLEFTLMKISPSAMQPGNVLPMLHTITSNVFKVVNAKDFDQVHPSTELVKGLLARGAGFPLKLKKGIREGQRRRGGATGDEVEGGEGSIEEEDGEDGDGDEEEEVEAEE